MIAAQYGGVHDPSPTARHAGALPRRTCALSCWYWCHFLRSWSLRQTWSGSPPQIDGLLHKARMASIEYCDNSIKMKAWRVFGRFSDRGFGLRWVGCAFLPKCALDQEADFPYRLRNSLQCPSLRGGVAVCIEGMNNFSHILNAVAEGGK